MCCGCDTSYSVSPHPVSSLHTYTFVVSRAFMAGAASQAGDADSSRAPGLTSGLQGSVNVHRGALLLVPQWQCVSSFVFYIKQLGECHCWWTREPPRAHVAKFYGRHRFICSVWEHQNSPCFKLIEIVILWVYYTIPFVFSLFRHFWDTTFQLLKA